MQFRQPERPKPSSSAHRRPIPSFGFVILATQRPPLRKAKLPSGETHKGKRLRMNIAAPTITNAAMTHNREVSETRLWRWSIRNSSLAKAESRRWRGRRMRFDQRNPDNALAVASAPSIDGHHSKGSITKCPVPQAMLWAVNPVRRMPLRPNRSCRGIQRDTTRRRLWICSHGF